MTQKYLARNKFLFTQVQAIDIYIHKHTNNLFKLKTLTGVLWGKTCATKKKNSSKDDEKPNIFLQDTIQTIGLYATEADDWQENAREDMEVDGQSRKTMPKQADEFKEQSAFYSWHTTRYLSAITLNICKIWRSNACPA